MTLRSIAFKNIKGNLNKFVMYYLSNALVVMVFFIFANFLLNPQVKNVKTMGQMGGMTAQAMFLCEIVILIFTVVFTNYSVTSFLKSREKEFGLLSMFGLTKGQIRSYVMFENLIVSLFSIGTGLLFGLLFSKLFFMAVSAILILDAELPLNISVKAIAITTVSFLVLFQGIGFMASYKIKNNNIIELLKGEKIAKPIPEFSRRKAVLSIVLIGVGYSTAVFSNQAIIFTMFPILIVTVAGTYLLYSQFSVYFTNKLKNNGSVFYKGTNMITLSQIIFKLRDNARILFAVSILSAVTLTASASVYSFQKTLQHSAILNYPQDISFVESGLSTHEIISTEKVEEILAAHKHEIQYKNKIILIKGTNEDLPKNEAIKYNRLANNKDFYIMSNSDYNSLAKQQKKPTTTINKGEVLVHSYNFTGGKGAKMFLDKKELKLNIEGESTSWLIKDEITSGIINANQEATNTAVLSDEDFNKIKSELTEEKLQVYYGYNIKNWMKAVDAVKEIISQVPKEKAFDFRERVIDISGLMTGMSLFFFIGTFIAILFFIATGSILYFKMFNEVQKDRQEFIALRKIGMSIEEVKKIVSTQCFIMFFLPFLIAFSHTSFAIIAFSNLLRTSLSFYLMIIVGIYLLLQIIYYSFAKYMYVKQINSWR
ncbi:FtsX-like permease family protein [Clostridium sp. UBA4548]|uniref:FtsX-like permease family protein n=1 Tax=Clostridium sp. UBA4548 TaxID=1946361 RepID=UPI0025C3A24B|nr:ABC transporter permease [Clostridium sp. UBA4548]